MTNQSLFAAMFDCSRNAVMKLETVKAFARILKYFGYNAMLLYTEDTYEIEGEPYFGYMRGRYTKEELKELDQYCLDLGIELIPCIQTLAHLNQLFRWPSYDNIHENKDILLPKEERTYELIDKMFQTCHECFHSKRIHIGMDEADVGRGKYLDKHGYVPRKEIIAKHLQKVLAIANKYGYKPMMWSDMFFGNVFISELSEKQKDMVPDNVDMVYWDYYSQDEKHYLKQIHNHKKVPNKMIFAGGLWSWLGFAPANQYALNRLKAASKACLKEGINDIIMTLWKDNGGECSFFATLPSLFAAKKFFEGEYSIPKIREEFNALTKENWQDFFLLDKLNSFNFKRYLEPANVAKWSTYEDPLFHMFYDHVDLNEEKEWKSISRKLKNAAKRSSNYSYVYTEGASLADFLSVKYGFAKKLYDTYQTRDKENLKALLPSFDKASKLLKNFYENFRALWYKENKGSGFEIQDARLGGLSYRLMDTKRIVMDYIDGKIDKIEELEDKKPLDINGKDVVDPKEDCGFYTYAFNMSVNAY